MWWKSHLRVEWKEQSQLILFKSEVFYRTFQICCAYQLNFIRFGNNKLNKMALRIGAFLLASYNFVSATLVGHSGYKLGYGGLYKGDRPEPRPVKGVVVKDYLVGAKNCGGVACSDDHSHTPHGYHGPHSDYHGHSHSLDHGHSHGHSHDHGHIHGHGHDHGHDHVHAIGHSHGKGSAHVHGVIQTHTHGSGHGYARSHTHGRGRSRSLSSDRYININRKFTDFKQIDHVDRDDKNFAKAHITTVNTPLVSSVGDLKHKNAKNLNKDRSNLPQHRNYKNYRAKKELLGYDNLLKTKVRSVKKVSVPLKSVSKERSKSRSPLKYKVVVPGRLEKKTFKQVAYGEMLENANPVITNFGAVREKSRSRSRSDRKFYRMNRMIRNITPSKDKPKKPIIVRDYSKSSISSSINEKNLKPKRLSRSRSHGKRGLKKHAEESSSDDYKYWMGLRPGRWYDAKRKDYLCYYGKNCGYVKKYHSVGAQKKTVIVKQEPVIIQKVVKSYGLHHH